MNNESHNFDSVRKHVRWVLAFALLVSVAANVLAAEPSIVGRVVAALPPVFLLLTVDVVGRVPRSTGLLGVVRIVATGVVALIAAAASYLHMHEVVLAYGEPKYIAMFVPAVVDGLAVVCSAGLFELDRRNNVAPVPAIFDTAAVNSPASVEEPVSSVASVSSAQSPATDDGDRVVVRSPQTSTVRPLAPVLTK